MLCTSFVMDGSWVQKLFSVLANKEADCVVGPGFILLNQIFWLDLSFSLLGQTGCKLG